MPKRPAGGTEYLGGGKFCTGRFATKAELASKYLSSSVLNGRVARAVVDELRRLLRT
jgi:hypothetical protein